MSDKAAITKARNSAEAERIDVGSRSNYGVTKEELMNLAENRELADLTALGGLDGVCQKLSTDRHTGLRDEQIAPLREVYGENRMAVAKRKTLLDHIIDSFKDLTLGILICAAFLSIILGFSLDNQDDWIQGFAILLAVVVVSGVTSVQNWTQDKQFEALNETKKDREVFVVRHGEETKISIYDVVVGDVFVVKQGEVLPCDGLYINGFGIKCDESAMTGEPKEIHKTADKPFLLGGSRVQGGAGLMLVTTVGADTSYGRIVAELENEEPPPTPLQEKLETLAKQIGYIGMVFGTLTFVVLLIQWLIKDSDDREDTAPLSYFLLGVTIVVVAVPEGLPLAVTISLAFSMKKMMRDQNLVRELRACETMGSATCICSDKTGTLTENRMTVVRGWFFGIMHQQVEPSTVGAALGEVEARLLGKCISGNSDASVSYKPSGEPIFDGNKTEGAMLHMLHKDFNLEFQALRKEMTTSYYRENFSSDRKRMSTVYGPLAELGAEFANHNVSFVKGASEIVLGLCSQFRDGNGRVMDITDELRSELEGHIDAMASTGLRTLCIAYRAIPVADCPQEDATLQSEGAVEESVDAQWHGMLDTLEADLCLLCITGIKDPVRKEVPDAVASCKRAGVVVRMVTGDNLKTAKHIARECGIYDDSGICMEGVRFRTMGDEERKAMLPQLKVLARSTPMDKLLLVNTLKSMNEVVSVTGDGTNDAPALHAAHVGLAMGIAGTEVAKEASKIIIMDDNFASIVKAVLWGRSVLENIRKFLAFQLTINIVALTITFVIACTNDGETDKFPITSVQLLWVNLIMDTFAALALATEPPHPSLLTRSPSGKTEPLLTKIMWKYMLGHSVFQIAFLLFLTLTQAGADIFDISERESLPHRTAIFNTFVFLQVFNKMNCRKINDEINILDGFTHSPIAIAVIVVIVVMQAIIVEVGGEVMSTTGLSFAQWCICIGLGALSIPVGYILRVIPIGRIEGYGEHHNNVHQPLENGAGNSTGGAIPDTNATAYTTATPRTGKPVKDGEFVTVPVTESSNGSSGATATASHVVVDPAHV